jgi:hypothetical protein
MFQRNLGWIRNKRDLTSSSTRQLLQNNMGLTIYLEGGYVIMGSGRGIISEHYITVHLVLIRLALRRKIRKYDFCGV